jgi:polysaccharide biosynthesis protein PslH
MASFSSRGASRARAQADVAQPRKVLVLAHEPPLPAISGTRVHTLNLILQLARRGWTVSLFALAPGEQPDDAERRKLEQICDQVVLESFASSRAARYLRVGLARARGRAFQERYFFSGPAARRLEQWIDRERFDAILASQLYMYPYVPGRLRRRTALDCHNVERHRVETMAASLWPRPRGIAARLQVGAVTRWERDAVGSVARVLAVSEPEREYFERFAPGRVSLVPNGVDCATYAMRRALPAEPRLLFVGSMDYSANADAVQFMIREILPQVRNRDAQLTVVGGGPSRAIREEAGAAAMPTEVAGRVPSTEPYFARSRLQAVPLRFGGGTRLKILESLARGVPVLSTAVGCEGLGLTHEHDVVIADDPRRFAEWIDRLLTDDELCASLARNGRRTAEQRFDWSAIGDRVDEALLAITGSP